MALFAITWAGKGNNRIGNLTPIAPADTKLNRAVTNCVEIDVESPAVVHRGEVATFSAELTNCGDETAWISLSGTLTIPGYPPFDFALPPVRVCAGETFAKSLDLTIPQFMPLGTYSLCITATSGSAQASDCTSTEVVE